MYAPPPRLASPFDFCVPSARNGLPPDVEFAYRLVTANINFQSTAATAIPSVILHLYSSHYLIYRNLVKSHCLLGGKKAIKSVKSGQIGKLCIMSMIHCLALQTSLLVRKDVCICMLFACYELKVVMALSHDHWAIFRLIAGSISCAIEWIIELGCYTSNSKIYIR